MIAAPFVGRHLLRRGEPSQRWPFAAFNLLLLFLLFDWGPWKLGGLATVSLVLVQYQLLRRATESTRAYRSAIAWPIGALICVRFALPPLALRLPEGAPQVSPEVMFLGISYLAFRLSLAAVEVRAGAVELEGPADFLSFALFVPSLVVGPITSFRRWRGNVSGQLPPRPWPEAFVRIAIGAVKFTLLANWANQLGFDHLMRDESPIALRNVLVSGAAYYLYLYFNFSGFCDMMIGVSALCGVRLEENFDWPLVSRNLQDFWARWHITLGMYMKVMMFTPISKALVTRFGPESVNASIAATLFLVFVTLGVWHGSALNYLYFGLFHALGVVAVHTWGVLLKSRLSRERFKWYRASRVVQGISWAVTFVYISLSFVLFANTHQQLAHIVSALTQAG